MTDDTLRSQVVNAQGCVEEIKELGVPGYARKYSRTELIRQLSGVGCVYFPGGKTKEGLVRLLFDLCSGLLSAEHLSVLRYQHDGG